ncbi:MAG TPA: hypothetical protein VNW47_16920 [Terriglobales bacterium]|jgi:hypothetical protein|nr:hypothetical protein [Terriglobales bacterium]
MRHDGISVTAMMALAAFAVERVTTGILFLLSCWSPWRSEYPDPESLTDPDKIARARRKSKLAYFVLASALVLVVVKWSPEIRILHALNLEASPVLDVALTCLVLIAGSDRIGDFLKGDGGGASEKSSKPVEIVGRVQLIEPETAAAERRRSA